jgi:hypothetical protein
MFSALKLQHYGKWGRNSMEKVLVKNKTFNVMLIGRIRLFIVSVLPIDRR